MTAAFGAVGYGLSATLTLKALAAAIVGGIGSLPGAFLGGLVIGARRDGLVGGVPDRRPRHRRLCADDRLHRAQAFGPARDRATPTCAGCDKADLDLSIAPSHIFGTRSIRAAWARRFHVSDLPPQRPCAPTPSRASARAASCGLFRFRAGERACRALLDRFDRSDARAGAVLPAAALADRRVLLQRPHRIRRADGDAGHARDGPRDASAQHAASAFRSSMRRCTRFCST